MVYYDQFHLEICDYWLQPFYVTIAYDWKLQNCFQGQWDRLPLSCLNKPVDLWKLFNAAGLEGLELDFQQQSKGCDFMHVI